MTPIATKPQVEREQLQLIVAGLAEGILIIDMDGSIVWANEAALAIHDCKRLSDLGANAAQYRKKFMLAYRNHRLLRAKQYPIERLKAGETFRDVVVEVTRPDDAEFRRFQQLRGLIVTEPGSAIESLVLVIEDVTERYCAEERFERTFNANPAPALICRLTDLRYIRVNSGFLEMTGYKREMVLESSLYEIDVLENAHERDQAIEHLQQGKTISQREALVRLPAGDRKFVIVAGQPLDVGEEACMLFTFIDLDARKKTEDALRASEERFSKAFHLAPVPMAVCKLPEFDCLDTNDAFVRSLDSIAGQDSPESGRQQLRKKLQQTMRQTLATSEGFRNQHLLLRSHDGTKIDCLLSAETISIGSERYVLCIIEEVTERKRTETELMAAIETVMKDTSWFSHSVIEKLAQLRHPGATASPDIAHLTPREMQVLGLICEGRTDADIAAQLRLSRNTVHNHLATLYGKIGVNRRSAAVVWGRERGLIGGIPGHADKTAATPRPRKASR